MYHFIVKVPFSCPKTGEMREVGHRISDAEQVAAIHEGEWEHLQKHCIRIHEGQGAPRAADPAAGAATLARLRQAAVRAPVAQETPDRVYAPSS